MEEELYRCETCGNEFVRKSGRRGPKKRYCTDYCRWNAPNSKATEKRKQTESKREGLKCYSCGSTFTGSKQSQKFCSRECAIKYANKNYIYRFELVCKYCGSTFHANKDTRQYCSQECRIKDGMEVRASNCEKCENCGESIVRGRRGNDSRRFCSRECSNYFGRNISLSERVCKLFIKTCSVCGILFSTRFPNKKYCGSIGCATLSRSRYYVKKNNLSKEFKCIKCNRLVLSIVGSRKRKYCSDKCAKKAAKHKRLYRNGNSYSGFNPFTVFERDKFICQLCGIKTLKSKRGSTHPRAPELDHIIPLSKGGEHSERNTQCCCRRCNGKKGASLIGQLRMY